ncbi:MAG: hypothetical protein R2746_07150 [Acidimicrobiales bacterium]
MNEHDLQQYFADRARTWRCRRLGVTTIACRGGLVATVGPLCASAPWSGVLAVGAGIVAQGRSADDRQAVDTQTATTSKLAWTVVDAPQGIGGFGLNAGATTADGSIYQLSTGPASTAQGPEASRRVLYRSTDEVTWTPAELPAGAVARRPRRRRRSALRPGHRAGRWRGAGPPRHAVRRGRLVHRRRAARPRRPRPGLPGRAIWRSGFQLASAVAPPWWPSRCAGGSPRPRSPGPCAPPMAVGGDHRRHRHLRLLGGPRRRRVGATTTVLEGTSAGGRSGRRQAILHPGRPGRAEVVRSWA